MMAPRKQTRRQTDRFGRGLWRVLRPSRATGRRGRRHRSQEAFHAVDRGDIRRAARLAGGRGRGRARRQVRRPRPLAISAGAVVSVDGRVAVRDDDLGCGGEWRWRRKGVARRSGHDRASQDAAAVGRQVARMQAERWPWPAFLRAAREQLPYPASNTVGSVQPRRGHGAWHVYTRARPRNAPRSRSLYAAGGQTSPPPRRSASHATHRRARRSAR